MTIKRISFKNLKGRSEDVELGKATFIHGRNFTGKSAIVDAIKLAFLGFHPSLDKTARGAFELSSGAELTVSAHIQDTTKGGVTSHVVGRTWRRKGETITKKDFVPMGWPDTPVVLLDANDYFGKSDRGKIEMLFAAGKIEGGVTIPELSKNLIGFDLMVSTTKDDTPQSYVERALDVAEKARSEAAASAKRFADTMQGLSALQQAEPSKQVSDDTIANLKRLRGELEAAQKSLADAERQKALAEKTVSPEESEIKEAEQKIQTLKNRIADKSKEKLKAQLKWSGLLDHESCPMCGTAGDIWRDKANQDMIDELEKFDGDIQKDAREQLKLVTFVKEEQPKVAEKLKRQKAALTGKITQFEESVAELREEIGELEKLEQAAMNETADRKRLTGAREEHEKAVREETQFKAAKKFLLTTKEQMVREMFGPILKVAEAFTRNILKYPLAFNGSELGYAKTSDDGATFQWVAHRTFSGTEAAIAFAVLQAALGATAPIKLVVMDELGRIDDDNKSQLLQNVAEALDEGIIQQFIGIDTKMPGIEPRGDWKYIERT